VKLKTSELEDAALAYAVELANGYEPGSADMAPYLFTSRRVKPDSDWATGGPLIERQGMHLERVVGIKHSDPPHWKAVRWQGAKRPPIIGKGPTPLVAVCRCYVAGELGDEVEIPEELL
jgi:hypothetical protein